jgi:hypothetical protein
MPEAEAEDVIQNLPFGMAIQLSAKQFAMGAATGVSAGPPSSRWK